MWDKYTSKNQIPAALYIEAFELLREAVPLLSRREDTAQRAVLRHSSYCFYVHMQAEKPVAVLAAWEFPSIRYIEHFVVKESHQSSGLGSSLFKNYLMSSPLPLILETEPKSLNERAERRISFYERQGLQLNDHFVYDQPPLRKNSSWLPMQMMSWPGPLSTEAFEESKLLLYREVYALSSPSLITAMQKQKK